MSIFRYTNWMERSPREGLPEYGIDHMVGSTHDQGLELVVDHIRSNAERIYTPSKIEGHEVSPTEEELRMFNMATEAVNRLRQQYGKPPVLYDAHNMHVVDPPETIIDHHSQEPEGGKFLGVERHFSVHRTEYPIKFLIGALHELTHGSAYNSLQADQHPEIDTGVMIDGYRTGFMIINRPSRGDRPQERHEYFRFLNESLTEEIAIRMEKEINDPLFDQDRKSVEDFHEEARRGELGNYPCEWVNEVKIYEKLEDGGSKMHMNGYFEHRIAYGHLFKKLSDANPQDYPSEKDVWDAFIDAVMTGNILTVARAIEQTFGKGTFRILGEKDKNLDELKAYIESLTPLETRE